MNNIIFVLSGKKQAGKSTAGKCLFNYIANRLYDEDRYVLEKNGDVKDTTTNTIIDIDANPSFDSYGIKLYSFADPLKQFCNQAFGIDPNLLYGSDSDKNKKTHITWENMPQNIRVKYSKPKRGSEEYALAQGRMSVREILQVFGTDICRAMDENCWARALYATIEKEDYPFAIVMDARFPNEITMGTERGAKVIRLLRAKYLEDQHASEVALDDFALGEYTHIIDNSNMTLEKKNAEIIKIAKQYIR